MHIFPSLPLCSDRGRGQAPTPSASTHVIYGNRRSSIGLTAAKLWKELEVFRPGEQAVISNLFSFLERILNGIIQVVKLNATTQYDSENAVLREIFLKLSIQLCRKKNFIPSLLNVERSETTGLQRLEGIPHSDPAQHTYF